MESPAIWPGGGALHFTLVVAGRQTRGRGRLQRVWQSAPGGLYFTLVLRPAIPPLWIFRINFAASLVLAEVLAAVTAWTPRLKWPNDVLVDGRQNLGHAFRDGGRSRQRSRTSTSAWASTSTTIPAPEVPGATSVSRLLGRPVSRTGFWSIFSTAFKRAWPPASTP